MNSDTFAAQIEKQREEKALKILLKQKITLTELANRLDVSPKVAQAVVDRLSVKRHDIRTLQGELSVATASIPEVKERLVFNSKDLFNGKWHAFGVTGDNHLASKYSRLDVLNGLFDAYAAEGITTVFQTGNILDGECRFNKHDLLTRSGMEAQIEYLVEQWPARKGITTHFVVGDDHEGWWTQREGMNVGERIEDSFTRAGRKDMKYIGYMERDVEFKTTKGSCWGRVVHLGGGSSYAFSYAMQKLIESYQGGEKPQFVLAGHLHKFDWCFPREVHAIQTGTTEDQTPFMRKQKIQAHVGGLIIRFHQAETGEINRFMVEWMPWYDRKFHSSKAERFPRF